MISKRGDKIFIVLFLSSIIFMIIDFIISYINSPIMMQHTLQDNFPMLTMILISLHLVIFFLWLILLSIDSLTEALKECDK